MRYACTKTFTVAAIALALAACGDDGRTGATTDTDAPIDTVAVDTSPPDVADDSVAPTDTADADAPTDTGGSPDTVEPGDTTAHDTLPGDTVAADTSVADTAQSQDPCGGVPIGGVCVGDTLSACVTGTGSGEPFVISVPCGAGYACVVGAAGAGCVPNQTCVPGDSECRPGAVARCTDDGTWVELPCVSGCSDSAIGAFCPPGVTTTHYANTVEYELRSYDEGFTDWDSAIYTAPARRFLVISFANGEILDATVTDDDGAFDLDVVPSNHEDGDDFLALFAVAAGEDGDLVYAVASPGGAAGERDIESLALQGAPDPNPWVWTWTVGDIPADAGVYLPLEAGSGAAFVFVYLSTVHDFAVSLFGERTGASLVVWMDYGVSWDCGACFLDFGSSAFDVDFGSQMFIPGDADEGYWSGAVLAHELGHWLMATYGAAPGEGGTHVLGVPTHPGIAWSEGFATWFSALVRREAFYYDKQGGLFFWVDLAARAYSSGAPWYRPVATLGLEQLIDENEVARLLLGLTTEANAVAMVEAVSSARMTTSPFLRGYLRRTWDGLDPEGYPLPAWSVGPTAPYLADYLDAVMCDGLVSASAIDAQTEPATHYPYPSQAPLCLSGEPPIQVAWRATDRETVAEVRWYVPLTEDLVLGFVPSTGAPTIVPAGTPPGELALVFIRDGQRPAVGGSAPRPEALEVSGAGAGWRVAGRVPFAPEPVRAPVADGPAARIRQTLTGPSIRLRAVPLERRAPRADDGLINRLIKPVDRR